MILFEQSNFLNDMKGFSLAPQGFRAETFWNNDYVVQKRDIGDWERWQTVLEILEQVDDPDRMLLGLEHQYQLQEDFFWLRFPRFDLQGSPGHLRDLTPKQRREFFELAFPDYLKLDTFLKKLPPDKKLLSRLISYHPQKTEAVMRYGESETRAMAKIFSYQPPVSYPKDLSYAYQHGDLSLGNTILTEWGYRLIDWESFAWHEGGRDLTHVFCFLLLPTPVSQWKSIVNDFEKDITSHLAISAEEWRLHIYWEMLREFLFWQKGEDLEDKIGKVIKALELP